MSIIAFASLAIFSAFNFSVKSQNEIETFRTATPTETPHNLVGTYYNLRDYSGKFLLNNKGIETITVFATLYNMSGQSITIPPETVNASSHRLIDLNNWALLGGESFKEGSIKIFHTGKDLVLGTQIYLENDNASFSFDEKLAELTKFDTRKQEAVWWMPNRQTDVKIALSNTSDTVLSINATLSRKPKKVGVTENFTLQPHQTRLLDLRNDFTDGSQFDNHDIIGLSLEHAGAKDALLARIMLKNNELGYSNVVQFSNPNTAKSNEYQGVGFHIDKLGGTQLEPIIIAKNVGTITSNVQIKVPYTRNNGTTNTIILPPENLKAGEMSQIDASQITNIALQENIKVAGIEVTYDTPNGSVIIATHSISPNRNQVYRVPMWDPFQQKSPTGGYPWRIEPTSTTKAYIKNITDQEEDYVAFLLWQNGGQYMIGLKAIKPHQSIEIDVKKLRDDQTPDERGRIIPPDINFGQLQWTLRRKDTLPDDDAKGNLALIGRSEQIDFVKNTSSNYACQNCCSGDFHNGYIEAADLSQNGPITAGTSRVYFAVEEQQTCYGGLFGFYEPSAIYNATWATNNSNIATVLGGLVTGINQGDAEITAAWYPRSAYVTPCGPPQQLVNPDGTLCSEKDEIFSSIKPAKEDNPTSFTKLAACGSCVLRRWQYAYTAYKYVSVVPNIRVTPLEVIGKNLTKQVFIAAVGTNNQPVTLTIQATTGTGEAKFTSNNSTTMTITQSQNVEIKGITESSQKDNLKITASFGNTTATDNFSVATVKIIRTVQTAETDVTDGKTKTIVGERQDLKATIIPADLTVTSHLWTVPDKAIKDFVLSDATRTPQSGTVLPLAILNTASVNFVWVDGNVGTTNKQVNYKAVIDGVNITANSGFNVVRPTVTVSSVGGTTMVNNTNPELFLGGASGSSLGILVTASSPVIPTGFTGQFHFVQLINGSVTRRLIGGTNNPIQLRGLDGCYPYTLNTTQFNDTPGAVLSNGTTTYEFADYDSQWNVFYMFKPSGVDSSWVPMKKFTWSWHGTATLVTGSNPFQWTPNNINSPGNPVGSDTTDYPTWTQILTDAAGCTN